MISISTPTKASKSRDWECSGLGSSDISASRQLTSFHKPSLGSRLIWKRKATRASRVLVPTAGGSSRTSTWRRFYLHGQDNVYLGNSVPANQPNLLPTGAAGPTWNGGFVEAHYAYSPQLIFTGRYELVHMSRQANPALLPNLGNVDSFTIGYRWYPIMFSRAGLAFHNEYAQAKMGNTSLLTIRTRPIAAS